MSSRKKSNWISALACAACILAANSASAVSVIWGDENPVITYGPEEQALADAGQLVTEEGDPDHIFNFDDGYIEFQPFLADSLVNIDSSEVGDDDYFNVGFFHSWHSGTDQGFGFSTPGGRTFTMDIKLDGIWTEIWRFVTPDSYFEDITFVDSYDENGPLYGNTQDLYDVSFDLGMVSGVQFQILDPTGTELSAVYHGFHKFNDTQFNFANSTAVPLPGAFVLYSGAIFGLISLRRKQA